MQQSKRTTACPLDCPDACSLVATVADDRVVSLDGDERNPITRGFICAKVRQFARHAYGKERLREPMLRTGPKGSGTFEPTDWDTALNRVCAGLTRARDTFGGESILPFSYGGSNGALTEGTVDARLFRRLGATELARTVCASATGSAHQGLYGKMPGVDYVDYPAAKLIVVWGFNPSASGIHLLPLLKQAQAGGSKLIVVDPRRTPIAGKADLHLPIRPGTDLALALGVIRWLFEHDRHDSDFIASHTTGAHELRSRAEAWTLQRVAETTGLDATAVETFARLYADASPAVIRCGWGLERNRNGGSAVAAVLALPAVAGKFGIRGGGFSMSSSSAFRWDLEPAIREPAPRVRTVNMNELGLVLTGESEPRPDPKIAALFVYNCNPAATMPDQTRVRRGLLREDLFTVVFEQVMTDTCKYADVILPATTFLEHHDLTRGYGSSVLHQIPPVTKPLAQARTNPVVFAEVIRRLGLEKDGDPIGVDGLRSAILAATDLDPGDRDALGQDAMAERATNVLFVDGFPRTTDRKVHLCPTALDAEASAAGSSGLYGYRADPATPEFPLTLVSPALRQTVNSTLAQLITEEARLRIHPTDASARSVADGAAIRVFNGLGQVHCVAEITDEVRPGVVELSKGLWERHSRNGYTSNALCPPTLTDLGGGAAFNDARVDVMSH